MSRCTFNNNMLLSDLNKLTLYIQFKKKSKACKNVANVKSVVQTIKK